MWSLSLAYLLIQIYCTKCIEKLIVDWKNIIETNTLFDQDILTYINSALDWVDKQENNKINIWELICNSNGWVNWFLTLID